MGHFSFNHVCLDGCTFMLFNNVLGMMFLFVFGAVLVNGLRFLGSAIHLKKTVKNFHQGLFQCTDREKFIEHVSGFLPYRKYTGFDMNSAIQRVHDIYQAQTRFPDRPQYHNGMQSLRSAAGEYFSRNNMVIMAFNLIVGFGFLAYLLLHETYTVDIVMVWFTALLMFVPYIVYLFREYFSRKVVDEINRIEEVYKGFMV